MLKLFLVVVVFGVSLGTGWADLYITSMETGGRETVVTRFSNVGEQKEKFKIPGMLARVSPSGTRFASVVPLEGGGWELCVFDGSGKGRQRIDSQRTSATRGFFVSHLEWSPDEKQLAMLVASTRPVDDQHQGRGHKMYLHVQPVSGGESAEIVKVASRAHKNDIEMCSSLAWAGTGAVLFGDGDKIWEYSVHDRHLEVVQEGGCFLLSNKDRKALIVSSDSPAGDLKGTRSRGFLFKGGLSVTSLDLENGERTPLEKVTATTVQMLLLQRGVGKKTVVPIFDGRGVVLKWLEPGGISAINSTYEEMIVPLREGPEGSMTLCVMRGSNPTSYEILDTRTGASKKLFDEEKTGEAGAFGPLLMFDRVDWL